MAVEGKVKFWGDQVVGSCVILFAIVMVLAGMDALTMHQFMYELSRQHPKPEYSVEHIYTFLGILNIPLRISDGSMVKFYWAFIVVAVLLLGAGFGIFRSTRTAFWFALCLPFLMSLGDRSFIWIGVLVALYALLRLTNTIKIRKV